MKVDLSIQQRHLKELRTLLMHQGGVEAAAYILCGISEINSDPWDKQKRYRYTSYEVLAIPSEDVVSADTQHITWSTNSFIRLLKRAKQENLLVGIVHTHPKGSADFSAQDDKNEFELAKMTRNRNGSGAHMLSMLFSGENDISARLWIDQYKPVSITPIRVVGRQYTSHGRVQENIDTKHLDRQALLLGNQINITLRSLRIGVVGCGGTGSAVAMLLARLGVGQLLLLDEDIVESTNLNRLHGSKQSDADAMKPKVEVVAREITDAGLGTRVVPIRGWVGNPIFRDTIKSCDIIFGCTDDHDGRILLNRIAYFYLIPVIDVGLAIVPADDGGKVKELSGRSTILIPEAPCLLCHGIVDPVKARNEELRRKQPEEFERRKREAYIQGGENPAPAVVTFTTATACMAVDELLQGLSNFRNDEGWSWHRIRRFDLFKDRQPGASRTDRCPICVDKQYWGRADVQPFLDRVG